MSNNFHAQILNFFSNVFAAPFKHFKNLPTLVRTKYLVGDDGHLGSLCPRVGAGTPHTLAHVLTLQEGVRAHQGTLRMHRDGALLPIVHLDVAL